MYIMYSKKHTVDKSFALYFIDKDRNCCDRNHADCVGWICTMCETHGETYAKERSRPFWDKKLRVPLLNEVVSMKRKQSRQKDVGRHEIPPTVADKSIFDSTNLVKLQFALILVY